MVCVTLNRDLKIGSQGDDVKNIQQMLSQHPESGFSGSATGFFGPMTAKAMMMFQMRNGIASSTDGHVGPLTRGFFERHCGEGLGNGDGGQGMGGMMNGGAITGSITANTGSSITISEKSGTSRVVNITASTTIQIFSTSTAPIAGSVSDLTVGKMGGAKGTLNSDGSIQAMMIMVGMVPPPPPMMNGDDHGGMKPYGVMPTASSTQGGHGDFHGGAQNW
jgi:peptidoglycan hydrolase-like protein with peptidoglycan-binding domain